MSYLLLAIAFFLLAIISAVFGAADIVPDEIARIFILLFTVLAIVALFIEPTTAAIGC